jgi:dolichol-phosphate mannosyltransferase
MKRTDCPVPIGKLYVGVPAYNAAESLGDVLDGLSRIPEVHRILVVDDGSDDRTWEVMAARPGVACLRHHKNRGVAAAQRSLFREFLRLSAAADDIFMIVHADGAMDLSEIGLFLDCFTRHNPDVVLGSRLISWRRNLRHRGWFCTSADMALSLLENLAFRTWLTSYGSGFRAWKRGAVERIHLDEMFSSNASWDVELVARGVLAGLKIREVSIRAIPASRSVPYLLTVYARDTLRVMARYGLWRWMGLVPNSARRSQVLPRTPEQ